MGKNRGGRCFSDSVCSSAAVYFCRKGERAFRRVIGTEERAFRRDKAGFSSNIFRVAEQNSIFLFIEKKKERTKEVERRRLGRLKQLCVSKYVRIQNKQHTQSSTYTNTHTYTHRHT